MITTRCSSNKSASPRRGVHKRMSANLYKGMGSRFAQGISNADFRGGFSCRDVADYRLLAAMSRVRYIARSHSLERKKNLCADPVADIKMQVVRACAPLFIRLDIGVLWATALCVPQ